MELGSSRSRSLVTRTSRRRAKTRCLKVRPPEDDEIRRGGGRARALGRRRGRAAAPARPLPARIADRARRPGRHLRAGGRGGDRGSRSRPGSSSGGPPRSRSAGSATTYRGGSTEPRATSSLRSRASSTPRSTSAGRRSCTATSITTTSSGRRAAPLAIDPKPMLGEPEYDVPLLPLEPALLPDAPRRDRAPARRLRRGGARRGADAEVDGDPRRVSSAGRDRGATRARLAVEVPAELLPEVLHRRRPCGVERVVRARS